LINNKFESLSKKEVAALFEIMFHHLPEGTKKNNENPQSK
jgi:hypothetical protein